MFCDYTCTAKRYLVAHLKKKHSSEALDPALEDEEGLEEDEEDVKSDDEEVTLPSPLPCLYSLLIF